HAWARIAAWTVAYLNAHPDATARLLKNAAPNAADSGLDAVPLAPRVFLIRAWMANFTTVFIVDGADGRFRLAWSIRGSADRDAFPVLSSWAAAAASRD